MVSFVPRALSVVFSVFLLVAPLACGDDSTFTLDSGPSADRGRPPADSSASPSSAMQVVVNKLTLPTKAGEYALDLDNDGTKDNKLATMLGALAAAGQGLDPQAELDKRINNGSVLLLYDIQAASLVNAAKMTLVFHTGADQDKNPADNFSGTEPFGKSPNSPKNLFMSGAISNGKLSAGPNTMVAPTPLGTALVTLSLKLAQMKATASKSGLSAGQMNGAVPVADVTGKLLPNLAGMFDDYYKNSTNTAVRAFFKTLDTDGDGTIGPKDLSNNPLTKVLLQADVDTDGDGTADALSLGLGFTAVPCIIP